MAFRLNRVPSGLLSFFGVKSLGANPQAIEETVRVSLEASNFYFSNIGLRQAETLTTGVALADQGTALAQIEVPDGEIWALKAVESFITQTTSGVTETMWTVVTLDSIPASGNAINLTAYDDPGANANFGALEDNSARNTVATFDNPLFLPPSSRLYSTILKVQTGDTLSRYTVGTRCIYYPVAV